MGRIGRSLSDFAGGLVGGAVSPAADAAHAVTGRFDKAHSAGRALGGLGLTGGAYALGKRHGKDKTAMDRELASAIIDSWAAGEAVSETQLYKAAQALDIDPMAALVEARFYTYLDKCLLEKRAMSRGERIVFSAAAGLNDRVMSKTASAHGLSSDELIVEALRDREFVPDLYKIANLTAAMPGMDPSQGGGPPGKKPSGPQTAGPMDPTQGMMAPPPDPSQGGPEQAAGDIMMAPPDPNAMLQQQQAARVKPSPTGPEQVAASPMGNLDELVQQGQQVFGDQAMENGGTAPQGMPEPAPPPPSPEERVRQVGPNLDDETVARYAEQLQRFEEGFQMQISDPKQMVKFVKELQKVDGKKVDQGIKAMGEQLEQEQAQELGVDSNPTIDGPGGAAMGGGPGTKMAPKPGGQGQPPPDAQAGPMSGSQPSGGDPQSSEGGQGGPVPDPSKPARPPRPQPKAAPPQQSAEAAVEKVANAARALARASF